ncbi:hypothetical protein [Bradyrhizobium sp. CCBAU 51765]|uniref:hypothetical protein n=1 Tax=Bradyrhizobium sp. CCBAU 51765 TaxID=1325102 RepID=UPI001886F7DD|nr:hypothetical protein [Bradyrhizobium sp. CCBAU 51765]
MSKYVKCRIVRLGNQGTWTTSYRVTCSDARTRAFVSSVSLPALRNGAPPPVTMALLAELLDGHLVTSVCIEIEPELWPSPSRLHRGGPIQDGSQPSLVKIELA